MHLSSELLLWKERDNFKHVIGWIGDRSFPRWSFPRRSFPRWLFPPPVFPPPFLNKDIN